jgi:hypothetical protein
MVEHVFPPLEMRVQMAEPPAGFGAGERACSIVTRAIEQRNAYQLVEFGRDEAESLPCPVLTTGIDRRQAGVEVPIGDPLQHGRVLGQQLAMLTESVLDPHARLALAETPREIDAALEARVRAAQGAGEVAAAADPKPLAKLGSAVLHSLAVRARAGDPVEDLRAVAAAGIDAICR